MTDKALILVFYKNPVLGRVKTRLAKTIGDEKALAVYHQLASHTKAVVEQLEGHKRVCYSDYTEPNGLWPSSVFQKYVQRGEHLGDRMHNAFLDAFKDGYNRVGLVGTDIFTLTPLILEKGYRLLLQKEVVIGPALDGGYYYIGMRSPHGRLFQNKAWSTDTVFTDTMDDLSQLELSYGLLPTLNDVDDEEDMRSVGLS